MVKTIYYTVVVSEEEEADFLKALKDLMLCYDKEFEEEEEICVSLGKEKKE